MDEVVQNLDVGRKDNVFHIVKSDSETMDIASRTRPATKSGRILTSNPK